MTDENKAISVNRWRLVLGGMSDKSLSFTLRTAIEIIE